MNENQLAEAFYQLCVEEGSTASIQALRDKAFAKLASGEDKSLISSSISGKSFSYNLQLPAHKMFAAASLAMRRYNQGVIKVSAISIC